MNRDRKYMTVDDTLSVEPAPAYLSASICMQLSDYP